MVKNKKIIEIFINNIYCDKQEDLVRLRKFYKDLNKICSKHLLPIVRKHCSLTDNLIINYDNGTYKRLKFEPLKYDFDKIIYNSVNEKE